MSRERLYLFDTTLRDGAQTNGVDFTLADKLAIIAMLDKLGIDYVEGGYPGANPTDTALFSEMRLLNTTFTAFFFASRLGVEVTEVAGIIATLGGVGVLAVTAGALGGGFLSDRFRRRKVFVIAGGVLMAAGMVLMAVSAELPALIAGSLIVSTGIGMFSAVDQALLLDVLPEKATDAGRFMGITGFATSIPQSAAPLIASAILLVGVTGAEKNYSLLFFVAAALVLAGGLVILRIRSVR